VSIKLKETYDIWEDGKRIIFGTDGQDVIKNIEERVH
jgi:hypothetical protein